MVSSFLFGVKRPFCESTLFRIRVWQPEPPKTGLHHNCLPKKELEENPPQNPLGWPNGCGLHFGLPFIKTAFDFVRIMTRCRSKVNEIIRNMVKKISSHTTQQVHNAQQRKKNTIS